jgi:HK97 gp10 family phage protein
MSDLEYVQGLDALTRRLQSLPNDVSTKVIRGAVYRGATVIRDFAAAFAPVASTPINRGNGRFTAPGTLRANGIVKYVASQSGTNQVQYLVTFRQGKAQQKSGNDAFYARFLEFGHYTRPAGGGRIPRRRFREGFLASGAVSHFVLPRKFLTPAFTRGGQLALDVMTEAIAQGLAREFA